MPDGNELQFKVSLARAEQFMNELRRMGFDIGHDADYQDPGHFMTVIVRDVPAGRKRLLLDTANRYVALLKSGGNERYKYVRTDDWSRKIYKDTTTGKYYVDVEGELHTMTEVGEPMYSIGVKTPGSNPGNPGEKTVHGYNYKVRIWYPNAPENSTEGMMLAAYDEDLAKEIQRQYPGVTYEIISKEPVLGDPQPQHGGNPQRKWAASQVWAACKQAGVPVEEREVLVKHYQETGELPFQTWPSLRLIESWPEQPQLSPGNRYVVEAEVTSRRIYYVTAENEEDAKQKIRNRDYHDEREKGDYWWEFKFTEVRPARPDESQYYP